ncbi:hypothetical protein BFF78_07520 [Streptomyces fodineus]|uniref:Uncharacterized protein n=1 Tax=Streptomyces fodineus TaxID=1904616 RepID=A0A1D7Y5P3_9ACTN|nr:hypothetical protein [Streptomyces fodineus]AOR30918.1 hypothetical protein BFF78_07520 [Streptomyces fodineus]
MEAFVHVLIPDDPVLASNFVSLEQPLLHSLYYYYRTELTAPQVKTVEEAYERWGELQQMLPKRFQTMEPDAVAGDDDGYVLEGVAGQRLTRLYVVDVGNRAGDLEACYVMLRRAQLDGWRVPLGDVLREINDGIDYVDVYRRVMRVLSLSSPPGLLRAVRRVAPYGPATALALDAEQEREYSGHCDKIIRILSANDSFAYAAHRGLYAM